MKHSTKKIAITLLIILPVLVLLNCTSKSDMGAVDSQPNILLIISDDQAWTDYGFMGHEVIQTPEIDKLASQGLTFTRGYVTAPLCRPSLASMATGLHPHLHGITGNDPFFVFDGGRYGKEWMAERARLNAPFISRFQQNKTIQGILGDHGYLTYQTGKWWEGSWKDGGFTDGMTHGDYTRGGRHGDDGLTIGREGMNGLYDFMLGAQREQKPFFVWYAPFMPHTPHTPPDSLLEKYIDKADHIRIAKYMAMVEWFDITVGQLLDFLDDNELAENTVVVYICDNGWITNPNPEVGEVFMPRSKQSPYDMGIRTPVMVRWPDKVKPKIDTLTLVSSIDLAPTILDAAGLQPPDEMNGLNLLEQEKVAQREAVFAEDFTHDMYDIDNPAKSLESRIVVRGSWKLIVPYAANNDHEMELFNILDDPHEMTNVIDQHEEVADALLEELDQFWDPS